MLKEQKFRVFGKSSCQLPVTKLSPGWSRKVSNWTSYWRQSSLCSVAYAENFRGGAIFVTIVWRHKSTSGWPF